MSNQSKIAKKSKQKLISSGSCQTSSRVYGPYSTMKEWYEDNKQQYENTQYHGISADKILKISEMFRSTVKEITLHNKKETETRLEQRISTIQQTKIELQNISTSLQNEIEFLGLLKERVRDGIKMITGNPLTICEKCIKMRKERRGIDLSHDEVEKELETERGKIKEAENVLKKTLEQNDEHTRILRAALYLINKDIEDKERVLSIECDVLNTKETSLNLKSYMSEAPIDLANISVDEWNKYTEKVIESSKKKIKSARGLQVEVNSLLREIIENLRKQNEIVNSAFQRRILEVKEAKARLQMQHFEITRQVNDMNNNISNLEISKREKENFLALAHTRLEKRSRRRGIELVRDEVEATLVKEVLDTKQLILDLQKILSEAEKSLRTLLQTQLQLEEAINIKTHTLKIDEVDCMTVRQTLEYHDI